MKEKRRDTSSKPAEMQSDMQINTDPNGSYTGVPTDPYDDKPIQDADDL